MFEKVKKYTELVRDIGLIIGVPTLIIIGNNIHSAEVDSLKAQIEHLKELQYDKAVSILRAQKESSKFEQDQLIKSIQMVGGGSINFDDFSSKYMCLNIGSKRL